jgi:hypothetical protein
MVSMEPFTEVIVDNAFLSKSYHLLQVRELDDTQFVTCMLVVLTVAIVAEYQ